MNQTKIPLQSSPQPGKPDGAPRHGLKVTQAKDMPPGTHQLSADVVVIGSGAGGAIAAFCDIDQDAGTIDFSTPPAYKSAFYG